MSQEEIGKEVEEIMQNADLDKNGVISYSEFILAGMNRELAKTEKNMKSAFNFLDRDSNGFITCDEMHFALGSQNFSNEMWKAILD